ncbi:STAS domain-containing protein [Streptosporangium sp. NPDC050855]|uniref:STAS domain-containing protein n=1 Tax=Streptosporangium sp. NPDC050855 TaxID=3366194 RepID=UPI0037B17511
MILLTSPDVPGGRVEITVYGDLDRAAGAELRRMLTGPGGSGEPGGIGAATVELDLAHVSFLDCAGARALLGADEHLRGLGREMVVLRPSRPVLRLLTLLGFASHLVIGDPGGVAGATRTPPGH